MGRLDRFHTLAELRANRDYQILQSVTLSSSPTEAERVGISANV